MRILILILVSISMVTGCGRQPREPLRIGLNSWPGNEFYFLAQEKRFFAQEGVPIKLVEHSTLVDVQRAYERGQVDAIACTLVEVLQTLDKASRPIRVFQLTDFSNGADVILVRSPIKDLRKLKGKRVAVEPPFGMFLLSRAMEKAGMKLVDLIVLPMNQSVMEKALIAGSIDAMVTYPPYSTNLLKRRDVVQIFNSTQLPGEIVDVIAIDPALFAPRKGDIKRFQRAWDRTLDYANVQPDNAYAIMGRREGISASDFRKSLDGVHMLTSAEQQKLYESGQLADTVRALDRVLRALDVIRGPDRTADVLPPGYHLAARSK